MRVAVITPYYRESNAVLRRAHESVVAQTYPATHFLVADGNSNPLVRDWAAEHIVLPRAHDDFGDTPRVLGAISALSQGYEAIAFLDADNWYYPNHIEAMVAAQRDTGLKVCVASRALHRIDGSFMYQMREDDRLVDTSCYFLTGEAAWFIPIMAIKPKVLSEIGDRLFWKGLRDRGFGFVRVKTATVAYSSGWKRTYEVVGETPPPGADKEQVGDDTARWLAEAGEEEKALWSTWLFGAPDRW
jgi:glycosyltransferase involved in cell wall biosynthesis